jgi:hypothetical protein
VLPTTADKTETVWEYVMGGRAVDPGVAGSDGWMMPEIPWKRAAGKRGGSPNTFGQGALGGRRE